MASYTLQHPEKGLLQFHDKKRYAWLASLFMPLFSFSGVALYFFFDSQWYLLAPIVLDYVLLPLLDWLFGTDDSNPPEEIVPLLEEDRYYRVLTWLTAPLHFIVFLALACFVASQPLSVWSVFAVALTAGMYSGLGINTAHELGHKNTRLEQLLARLILALPAYGHFCVEHNRGHHVNVATPEDPASSKMGESIYAFMLREVPGSMRRGWALEKKRLRAQGKRVWSADNEILQPYALTLALQGGLLLAFGWVMLPFLLVHNLWAWFQLTSANYIEHYGLLREQLGSGRYERPQPHHSWNANYVISNLVLFNLERHSDHHAHPLRRYQSLRNFAGIPQLPNGYFGMYLIAYVPWLWYRIMDPRLLQLPHIQGDLAKVNMLSSQRARICREYSKLLQRDALL